MKILAVSDRVMSHLYSTQVRPNYPDVDLLISCGDLPFYYLEYLVSALDVPLLYVCGNHDTTPQYTTDGRMLKQVNGGCDIHGQVVFEKGLIFAGLEGSMRYRPHAPLMYTESEMNREISRLVPRLLWNWVRHGRAQRHQPAPAHRRAQGGDQQRQAPGNIGHRIGVHGTAGMNLVGIVDHVLVADDADDGSGHVNLGVALAHS